jgi:hypothetical protein
MSSRVIRFGAAGIVLVSCVASRSAAQMQVEVGQTVGYDSPMGSFEPAPHTGSRVD